MKHIRKFESFKLNEDVPYDFEVGSTKGKIHWNENEKKDLQEIGADYISDNTATIEHKGLIVTVEKIFGSDSFSVPGQGVYSHRRPDWQQYGWGSGKEFGYKISINQHLRKFSETFGKEIRVRDWNSALRRIDNIFLTYKKEHLKESFFKNPFKSKDREYKSDHVHVMGEISDQRLLVLKTIDMLRDNGINCRDASGEITDGDDVWTVVGRGGIALKPDYRKKLILVHNLGQSQNIGSVNFSTPEKMASEIENILERI